VCEGPEKSGRKSARKRGHRDVRRQGIAQRQEGVSQKETVVFRRCHEEVPPCLNGGENEYQQQNDTRHVEGLLVHGTAPGGMVRAACAGSGRVPVIPDSMTIARKIILSHAILLAGAPVNAEFPLVPVQNPLRQLARELPAGMIRARQGSAVPVWDISAYTERADTPMTNVTSFHSSQDRQQELTDPLNLVVLRHWEQLRGERPAPDRKELDLRALAPALRWLGILERRESELRYDWRIAGSGLCDAWGYELRGTEAMTGMPRFERDTILRLFDRVITTCQPALMRMSLKIGLGERRCPAEALALPLADASTGRMLVAFVLVPQCPPGIPCHPVMEDAELHFLRLIWTEPVPGRAQPQLPPHSPVVRRKGIFTVIEGGRGRKG